MTVEPLSRAAVRETVTSRLLSLLASKRDLLGDIAMLGGYALAQHSHSAPSMAWLTMIYLLLVPGDLLRRTLGITVQSVSQRLVLGLAGSIAVAAFAAVLIQLYGLLIGIANPFNSGATAIGTLLIVATLICTAQREGAGPAGPFFPDVAVPVAIGAVAGPLLVVLGTARLDAGHSPVLVVLGFLLGAVCAVTLIRPDPRREAGALVLLYSLSLSILWSFTLRTPFLYGYDINQEYNSYLATLKSGVWEPVAGNAYNAMLSLTAMPAIWTDVSGLTGLTLFKAVYPMIFAAVPVVTFMTARKFFALLPALTATVLLAWNPVGLWQIAGVARQQVALLCFAVMMMLLLQRKPGDRPSLVFAGILGVVCALTHYTTSYIAIALLLGASVIGIIARRISFFRRRMPMASTSIPIVIPALMLVISLAWNVGVNQATQNMADATRSTASSVGLQHRGGLIDTWLAGTNLTKVSATELFQLSRVEATRRGWLQPYSASVQKDFPVVTMPEGAPGASLPTLKPAVDLGLTLIRQLCLLLILVGVGLLMRSRWRLRSDSSPPALEGTDSSGTPLAELALIAVGIAAIMRLNAGLSLAYNSERLLIQLSVVLAVPLAAGIAALSRLAARRALTRPIAVTALVGLVLVGFLDATGIRGLMFGNDAGNLQNNSEFHQRYAITATDLAATEWLSKRFTHSNQLYTDKYGALPFLGRAQFKDGLLPTITPALLDQRGYVLGTTENVLGGRARTQIGYDYAVYQFPTAFLDKYKARVYSNGSASIWN